MIAKLFNRFKKTPSKPLFYPNQRIAVIKRVGARNVHTDIYVSIESDMVLVFQKETPRYLIFKVRSNFYPCSQYEARDGEIVYFTKKNFKGIKYRTIR